MKKIPDLTDEIVMWVYQNSQHSDWRFCRNEVYNEMNRGMNAIDLKNAFDGGKADNFTVLLLRLIAKGDSDNRAKLAKGYPVEVAAVDICKHGCPYVSKKGPDGLEGSDPDWDEIVKRANKQAGVKND